MSPTQSHSRFVFMPFLLCEMTVCHIDHREKAYLSNPAQMSLPQSSWSLLLWNCHALVTCLPGATPGPSIPTHFPLHPNTVVQPCQLSTNTNKHQGSCQPHDDFTSQYCLPQNLQPTSIRDDHIRTCQQEFQGQGS